MKTESAQGVVIVDKPAGPTSHDIVGQGRRVFQTRRVGHAGTLDPFATGVLVLLVGEATKLSQYLTTHTKRYRATVEFGRETDSFDCKGKTVREVSVDVSATALEAALETERARTRQLPPAVSAVKVGGERAYKLARQGITPALEERPIEVLELRVEAATSTSVTVDVHVSKGYFIRSLARDLGSSLGVPAHVSSLRRLASGPFTLEEAHAWPPEHPPVPMDLTTAVRRALSTRILTEAGELRARQGKALSEEDFLSGNEKRDQDPESTSAWLNEAGAVVALGRETSPGEFRVVRGFRK